MGPSVHRAFDILEGIEIHRHVTLKCPREMSYGIDWHPGVSAKDQQVNRNVANYNHIHINETVEGK